MGLRSPAVASRVTAGVMVGLDEIYSLIKRDPLCSDYLIAGFERMANCRKEMGITAMAGGVAEAVQHEIKELVPRTVGGIRPVLEEQQKQQEEAVQKEIQQLVPMTVGGLRTDCKASNAPFLAVYATQTSPRITPCRTSLLLTRSAYRATRTRSGRTETILI